MNELFELLFPDWLVERVKEAELGHSLRPAGSVLARRIFVSSQYIRCSWIVRQPPGGTYGSYTG